MCNQALRLQGQAEHWIHLSPSLEGTLFMTRGELVPYTVLMRPLLFRRLNQARFLKTVKCRHRNGYLVVKIFIKQDPDISLRSYQRKLKSMWFQGMLLIPLSSSSGQGGSTGYPQYLHLPNIL
jgi:hypothetical protein